MIHCLVRVFCSSQAIVSSPFIGVYNRARKNPSPNDRQKSRCVPLVISARYQEATSSFSVKGSKYPNSLSIAPLVIFSFPELRLVLFNDDSRTAKRYRVGKEMSSNVCIHDLPTVTDGVL